MIKTELLMKFESLKAVQDDPMFEHFNFFKA